MGRVMGRYFIEYCLYKRVPDQTLATTIREERRKEVYGGEERRRDREKKTRKEKRAGKREKKSGRREKRAQKREETRPIAISRVRETL